MKKAIFGLILGILTLVLGACGNPPKTNSFDAPSCGNGQVLTYTTQSGYACRYNGSTLGGYQLKYQNPQDALANQAVQPPIAACPLPNQILVQWNGNWHCYYKDQFYPGNTPPPSGYYAPSGRGGEYCNNGIPNIAQMINNENREDIELLRKFQRLFGGGTNLYFNSGNGYGYNPYNSYAPNHQNSYGGGYSSGGDSFAQSTSEYYRYQGMTGSLRCSPGFSCRLNNPNLKSDDLDFDGGSVEDLYDFANKIGGTCKRGF